MSRGRVLALVVMTFAGRANATCPLESTWRAGDVYAWDELELARGGSGEWFEADRHRVLRTTRFTWQRDGSKLVITVNGARREVHFTIVTAGDGCTLRFDAPPVDGASTEFYVSS